MSTTVRGTTRKSYVVMFETDIKYALDNRLTFAEQDDRNHLPVKVMSYGTSHHCDPRMLHIKTTRGDWCMHMATKVDIVRPRRKSEEKESIMRELFGATA